MKKIICFLFGHKSIHYDEYTPNIHAPIVTKWVHMDKCLRCGNEEKKVWYMKKNNNVCN